MKKEVVSVNNLSVRFNHEFVLKNINFKLHEQEVLIVLGPNGAGKTTLLKALLNLIPYKGTITWSTQGISYLPPQELLVRKYLPPLTIAEFFATKHVNSKSIHEIINAVGLSKKILSKSFTALSTGQFQRMMIAWALVNQPKVLLFDEPTAGIDIGGEETIYSLLHEFWKERQLSIILVTHDAHVVWEHATNVLCLNKEIICHGRPEQVLTPDLLKRVYGTGVKWYEHRHRND